MLSHRLLLGTVFIAALLALAWLDDWLARAGRAPAGTVVVLTLAPVLALGAAETARLLTRGGAAVTTAWGVGSALAGFAAVVGSRFTAHPVETAMAGPVVAVVGALALHARAKRVEGAGNAAGAALVCCVALGVMPASLVLIRLDHGIAALVWVVAATKACDIGAYFTGVTVGRRKLIPWLSPGKTWEGLIGGLVASTAVGAGAGASLAALPVWGGAVLGLAVGAAGQAGDLGESLLKRGAGAKDSGSLPGFGGVTDLIDSLLPAAPVAAWLLAALTAP